jgi:Flp pilus assembly protein TadG
MRNFRGAVLDLAGNFHRDRRGSIAMIFAFAFIPLVLIAGLAVDYAQVVRVHNTLNAAADSAVLAAVAKTSPGYAAANAMTDDGTIATAAAEASTLFNAETPTRTIYSISGVNTSAAKANGSISATLQYTAEVRTAFMRVAGIDTVTISGTSTATNGLVKFIDFYLLLDNSPSMGVAATPADIDTMVNNTGSARCAFACHDQSDPNNYYNLARQLGVTLRVDVLRTATQRLMTTAMQTAQVANEFAMAIYTFNMNLTTVAPLTFDLATAQAQAEAIDLMPIPYQNWNNDQITNLNLALTNINAAMPNPGTGSSESSRQEVMFFVSDGVADYAGARGRTIETLNPALCTAIKSRGIQIAVLYTTYLPLPTNQFYLDNVAPFVDTIGPTMQSCASPGLYFEVSPSDGISEAMQALFLRVVNQAHLTQ